MIKLRFISQAGFISTAIKFVSRAPYISHVEFETPEGTFIGAHADGGVMERPANYCKPQWERRYALPATDEQQTAVIAHARKLIGTKYDLSDIVGLALQTGWHSTDKTICSEFVYGILASQYRLMLNVLPGKGHLVTPEMLHLSPYLIGHATAIEGDVPA